MVLEKLADFLEPQFLHLPSEIMIRSYILRHLSCKTFPHCVWRITASSIYWGIFLPLLFLFGQDKPTSRTFSKSSGMAGVLKSTLDFEEPLLPQGEGDTGKTHKAKWYVRKTWAQTLGCKVHSRCSRNFMCNSHYQAGLICLVNKLYMTRFYLAYVLEDFSYNFWVHSGMLSLNIYDVPQLSFQRNPLWN